METKVTACTHVRDWTSPKTGKTFKIQSVVFSDGQIGESFDLIPIGTLITDLECTPNGNYPQKVKLKGTGNKWKGKERSGNESFALSYAKDVMCARPSLSTNDMFALADSMYRWLEGKKSVQPVTNPIPPRQPQTFSTPFPPAEADEHSDLPF